MKASESSGWRFLICEAAGRVGGRVTTDNCEGDRLDRGFLASRSVVVGTDAGRAERLFGRSDPAAASCGVTCLCFTTPSAPVSEPILLLRGERAGPANELTVLSVVSPDHAPAGRHLIAINQARDRDYLGFALLLSHFRAAVQAVSTPEHRHANLPDAK